MTAMAAEQVPVDYWSMLFVFVLATFIGLGVIRRVSRLLYTPLMSLTNAISAIAVVGSLVVAGGDNPGTIRVLDDGRTKFVPSAEGKHRYLIVDPAQNERVIKTYVEIASAKPVPRQPRFRTQQKNQELPKKP